MNVKLRVLSIGVLFFAGHSLVAQKAKADTTTKTKDIPKDYYNIMGVPITFLDKHNQNQFEIVGFRKGDDGKDLRIGGKDKFSRVLIKRKGVV